MFHCDPPTTDLPNSSSPQPLQGDSDVLLLPLDPQITTPASLRRQKRLPGPTEGVQHEIVCLAERPDQLLGKGLGEHRWVVHAGVFAPWRCEEHVRDPGDPFTVAIRGNTGMPPGLLADALVGEFDRPDETQVFRRLAARFEVAVRLRTLPVPEDRLPSPAGTQLTPQGRGFRLVPDQLLTLVPSGVPQSQTGPQHVVRDDATTKMRSNDNENRTIFGQFGSEGVHPLHREVGIVLLGDALIVPGTLLGVRRRRDDQTYRLIHKGRDQVEAVAVKDGTAMFLDSHRT